MCRKRQHTSESTKIFFELFFLSCTFKVTSKILYEVHSKHIVSSSSNVSRVVPLAVKKLFYQGEFRQSPQHSFIGSQRQQLHNLNEFPTITISFFIHSTRTTLIKRREGAKRDTSNEILKSTRSLRFERYLNTMKLVQ